MQLQIGQPLEESIHERPLGQPLQAADLSMWEDQVRRPTRGRPGAPGPGDEAGCNGGGVYAVAD